MKNAEVGERNLNVYQGRSRREVTSHMLKGDGPLSSRNVELTYPLWATEQYQQRNRIRKKIGIVENHEARQRNL